MNGKNYAEITQTRHGWQAVFRSDVDYLPVGAVPFVGTHDRHRPRWRPTRKGIERVAAKVLVRLTAEDRFERERERYDIRGPAC